MARSRLAAWLLAATLLSLQVGAMAHELEHALGHHQDAACALHLFSNQSGKTFPALAPTPQRVRQPASGPSPDTTLNAPPVSVSYRSRAPPH